MRRFKNKRMISSCEVTKDCIFADDCYLKGVKCDYPNCTMYIKEEQKWSEHKVKTKKKKKSELYH